MRDYYDQTTIHPLGLLAVLVLGTAMLLLPRRYAVIPMIVMACFIAPAQRLVILSLDFNLLRIMVLFGFVRLLLKHEFKGLVLRPIDWLVMFWAITNTATYTVLNASVAALVNRLGFSFDAVGMYFLFRCLIRSWEDVDRVILGIVFISLPVAVAFMIEHATGRNLFSFLGGVPHITTVRDGRLRCQGAFAHPILAGCFWASVLPLIGAWWWKGGMARWLAIVGVMCGCLVIIACASSTPVMAVLFGMVGGAMYAIRRHMYMLRWVVLGSVVSLHLVMNAPVWHLMARVNVVGGSTGWHRYKLVDEAIQHFNEWWLFGTLSTAHWGRGLGDLTNQYILEGARGGLATLVLFISVIVLAFRAAGRIQRQAQAHGDRYRQVLSWALGVSLFIHVTNFMGVSYFGQIIVVWYLALAIIGSLDPVPAYAMARPANRRPPVLSDRSRFVPNPV